MRKILLLILILSFTNACFAQEKVKIPLKAAALSLFVPGGGQFYNESKIKFGIVCAIEGSLIGLTLYNHFKAEDYYNKYELTEDERYYDRYSDYYYKKQNDLWWLGVTIFLSTIDAYVDAHLYDFDDKKRDIHLKFDGQSLGIIYNF